MTKIMQFASINLSKHLSDLKLLMEVNEKLTSYKGAISLGVKDHIKKGTSSKTILTELKGMAQDNFNLIVKLVGEDTATQILNYE